MNPGVAGGGWMMAIKGTKGDTFKYKSSHWTTATTLNPTDTTRNDGDAKFNVFNYYPATDWLAIFPDVPSGGSISGGYGGWTWYAANPVKATRSLVDFFASNTQVMISSTPRSTSYYSSSIWSSQGGFQWFGANYKNPSMCCGLGTKQLRWGFAFNNEGNESSNDVSGGIGMNTRACSAGDYSYFRGNTGDDRCMRFEWYVR